MKKFIYLVMFLVLISSTFAFFDEETLLIKKYVNQSMNESQIKSLGFNLTSELSTLFYPFSNPYNFINVSSSINGTIITPIRVGIKANPTYELEINDTSDPSLRIYEGNSSLPLEITDSSTITSIIRKTGTTSGYIDIEYIPLDKTGSAGIRFFRNTNTTGTKRIQIFTGDGNATLQSTIGSDSTYFNVISGNVGIGTASPSTKLYVTGNTTLNGRLGVGTTPSSTYSFILSATNHVGTSGTTDYQRGFYSQTYANNDLYTYSTQQVIANTNIAGISSSYNITASDTNVESVYSQYNQIGIFSGAPNGTITTAVGQYIVPSIYNGTIGTYYALWLADTAGTAGTINTTYGVYSADTHATNYFAGNVGISTTTPNQKLHVVGNVNISSGNLTITALSSNLTVFTDGTNKLITRAITQSDITDVVYVPYSINLTIGSSSQNITNLSGCSDNSVYDLVEANGVNPAMNLTVEFRNVTKFKTPFVLGYYDGGLPHNVPVSLKKCSDGLFYNRDNLKEGEDLENHALAIMNQSNFNCGGNITVRFLHQGGLGNPAHNLYIDCVQLLG